MAPTTQKALVVAEEKGPLNLVNDWPVPSPSPGEILVKVISAALNPGDWLVQTHGLPQVVKKYPVPMGIEASGTVEEVGPDVTTLVKGDKVLFPGSIGSPTCSTFQQYVVCPADNAAKIPDNITFDQAASVPIGLATTAAGLWSHHPQAQSLDFPAPWEEGGLTKFKGQPAFIHGGSSCVGQYAIQMAKLQGFSPIITTASLHNETLLKSLGATYVVDRKLPLESIKQEVTKLAGDEPIMYAYAAIADSDSQNLAYDILAPHGQLAVTHPYSHAFLADKIARDGGSKKVVHPVATMTLPFNKKLGEELYSRITEWLETGVVVPNRVEVLPGGLNGISGGLGQLKAGQVSGKKLVVHPQDTA